MKEIFYYSIFAIILYFVLTHVFDNFNLEQENFDPSLVPVSSIVTLAKVAQKLVNGNGTLTNPGNLQIGSSASAPGNLTVTGNTTFNGTITQTGIANGLTIKNGTTSPDAALFSFGDGSGWRARFGKAGSPTLDISDNPTGGIQVTGNTTVSNTLKLNNQSAGSGIPNNLFNIYGHSDSLHFGWSGANAMSLDKTQSLSIAGNTTVSGKVTASGVVTGDLTNGKIQIGSWGGGPALYANDSAKPLAIHNDGTGKNVQIGFPGYSNNLTVTGNSTVSGDTTINGTLNISASKWHKSTDGKNRLHFATNNSTFIGTHKDHVWRNKDDGEMMTLDETNNLTVKGNINARTNGYNTRIGGIWTSPGIFAEGTNDLEIGAGSTNVYIGRNDGTVKNNLTVTGVAIDEAEKVLIMNWQYHGNCMHSQNSSDLTLSPCDTNNSLMYWVLKGCRIVHASSKKCLTNKRTDWNTGSADQFKLEECDRKNGNQVFPYNPNESKFVIRDVGTTRGNIVNRIRGRSGVIDVYDNNCGEDCVWVLK
jgi:hypothetical protein